MRKQNQEFIPYTFPEPRNVVDCSGVEFRVTDRDCKGLLIRDKMLQITLYNRDKDIGISTLVDDVPEFIHRLTEICLRYGIGREAE